MQYVPSAARLVATPELAVLRKPVEEAPVLRQLIWQALDALRPLGAEREYAIMMMASLYTSTPQEMIENGVAAVETESPAGADDMGWSPRRCATRGIVAGGAGNFRSYGGPNPRSAEGPAQS